MKKRWKILPFDPGKAAAITAELDVPPIIGRLLAQRGITDFESARKFFRPRYDHLYDPYLMKDMDKAVDRLQEAILNKEKILIYGDYDVDGTSSVAMVYHFLSRITGNIEYYVPERYSEGYGLSEKGIAYAAGNGFGLVITLDCGIKAVDRVAEGNKLGIDFIICDHHQPGEKLPEAFAVLDPKRDECDYPFKELCGCGVGFKLLQGFCRKAGMPEKEIYPYLDLVALAIGADIVPIVDENRVMAFYGLRQINSAPRLGIKTLLKTAGVDKILNVTDLVFIVAPRINAAGRIQSARRAVDLLISADAERAKVFSRAIEADNITRRSLDRDITVEAMKMIACRPDADTAKSTVVYDENWHKGVVGIVASRLIETYYRPTVVLTRSGLIAAGSARSVSGFDLYAALEKCSEYLIQFGGHKYAAGMTMDPERIDDFRRKFEEVVSRTIEPEQLIPVVKIDQELDFDEINMKLYRIINQMAPFGPGNMTPVFMTRNVYNAGYSKVVGSDGMHLKLHVSQLNNKAVLNGIAFKMAHHYPRIAAGERFDLVYTIEQNTWNGKTTLQLHVKDIRFEEG